MNQVLFFQFFKPDEINKKISISESITRSPAMFMNCSTGEKQSVEVGDCSTLNSYCDIVMVIINPRKKRCFSCTLKFDYQIT